MRNVRMTSRERVARMFRREDQDSVPRMESLWGDTIERWRREGFWDDPNGVLGSDFVQLCWSDPVIYPGEEIVLQEDDETITIRDQWGARLRNWKRRQGTPEHFGWECDSREVWESKFRPILESRGPSVDLAGAKHAYAVARRQGKWCHLTGLETFELLRRMIGDETAMMAMLEDPEWFRDMSALLTDRILSDFEYLLANGIEPDGVWVYGDMAYRSGVLCGPPLYREMVWPDHKRMADWAHQRGLPFIFHTDGDVNAVIEDYIGAGFDCLQPLEAKAGMDVRKLCPQYGDRMAFFGNCDVMVYATGDRDRIEEEIRTKLEAGKATKGYVYHSDHSVPPSVSWETYRFVIDCVDRYGNYD